jgi:oligosaccharide repeat unit polymerase
LKKQFSPNLAFIFVFVLSIIVSIILQQFEYTLNATSFIAIYLACSLIGFIAYFKNGNDDIFSPGYTLIGVFFMYSYVSGVFTEKLSIDTGGSLIYSKTLVSYYYLCIIAICSLFIGLLIKKPKKKIESLKIKQDIDPFKLLGFALILGLPFIKEVFRKFDFIHAISYGEAALTSRIVFREDLNRGVIDIIFVDGVIFLILIASTILFFNKKNSLVVRFFYLLPFICYVLYCVMSGTRGAAVNALFIPVFYYHYFVKRISMSRKNIPYILLGGILLFAFMRVLELVRHTSSASEMAEAFSESYSDKGAELFDPASMGELLVGTNQMYLMQSLEEGIGTYNYGSTVVSELLVFIPRSIYPNRPLPVSELYVYTFYRHVWDVGGGYGLFITMEGYWAFGLIGVIIFCFFYSHLVQTVYCSLINKKSYYYLFIYGNFFLYTALYAPRSGMVGNFKGFLMSVLTLYIFKQISRIKFKS